MQSELTSPSLKEQAWQLDFINQAIVVATRAHAGQVRKGTDTPYIVHPYAVAMLARNYTADPEIIAACLLHDVLEDVAPAVYSEADMLQDFGSGVVDLVKTVSEPKTTQSASTDKLKNEAAAKIPAADTLKTVKTTQPASETALKREACTQSTPGNTPENTKIPRLSSQNPPETMKTASLSSKSTPGIHEHQSLKDQNAVTALWKSRKNAYLSQLRDATTHGDRRALLVSAADKICNLHDIMADYAQISAAVWEKFAVSKADEYWFYNAVFEVVAPHLPMPMAQLYQDFLQKLAAVTKS